MTTQAEQVKMKIAELQQMLLSNHPQLPVLLRTIHSELKDDPSLVTIYSDEEIGIIVSGLIKHTGIEIATSKPKASDRQKLKGITVDDL